MSVRCNRGPLAYLPRKNRAFCRAPINSVGQQGGAVFHKHLAQHLRAVPLEMTHETVHRILTALMVREVAGVAEHILEAIPLDIGADRLEIEAGDPHVAA